MILNKEIIKIIENNLDTMQYGEIIIIKNLNAITLDIKVRNRILIDNDMDNRKKL